MELQQPEQPLEIEKLSTEQKTSLMKQLENLIMKETGIIITTAVVLMLIITPLMIQNFQPSSTIQGTRILPSPTPSPTATTK